MTVRTKPHQSNRAPHTLHARAHTNTLSLTHTHTRRASSECGRPSRLSAPPTPGGR
jgi:hypothetical protein